MRAGSADNETNVHASDHLRQKPSSLLGRALLLSGREAGPRPSGTSCTRPLEGLPSTLATTGSPSAEAAALRHRNLSSETPADFVRSSEDHSAWRPREQRLDEPSAAPPRAARAARTPASWFSQNFVEQDASSVGAGGEPRRRTPCAERSAPDDEHRAASAAEGARGPPRAPSPAAAAAAGAPDQLLHSGRAPSPSGPKA